MEEKNKLKENIYNIEIGDVRVSVANKDHGFKTGIVDAETGNNSTYWLKTIHSHADYEIFFIVNGSLEIFTEEGASSYSHKVIIVPPGYNHYTLSRDNNCYVSLFNVSAVQGKKEDQVQCLRDAFSEGLGIFPMSANNEFYIKRLAECFQSEDAFDRVAIEPLLSLVFHDIFNLVYTGAFSASAHGEERLKKTNHGRYVSLIESYIQKNYAEKINLTTLASELYLSTKQVARIIKKEYDCTFSELINRKRMSAACMLLKNTDMKISDIIKQLNYTSENYFYVLFKKYYGISPRKYRE